MLSGQNMVVQGALVVLNVLFAAIIAEKHFRQFQHIVGIAGFGALLTGNHRRKIGNRVKMFANTVSTNGRTSVIHYIVPEKACSPSVGAVIVQFCNAFEPNDLWNLRIGMQTV